MLKIAKRTLKILLCEHHVNIVFQYYVWKR